LQPLFSILAVLPRRPWRTRRSCRPRLPGQSVFSVFSSRAGRTSGTRRPLLPVFSWQSHRARNTGFSLQSSQPCFAL
jgi:hypothetical protein